MSRLSIGLAAGAKEEKRARLALSGTSSVSQRQCERVTASARMPQRSSSRREKDEKEERERERGDKRGEESRHER